jgi:endonuclease/exonuclease/phosphatase family metal-dependent hydrolase
VGLQEVENDRVLALLQRRLERAGCRYAYRAITHTKPNVIHVALLSRIPLKRTRDLLVTRNGRQRSILEAVLDTDPPLRFFVNHWRSKRGPESERIVYAKALKKRLDRLPAGSEYLLLGDFNSDWDEAHTIDPRHNDTGGRTGINHLLRTFREDRIVRLDDVRPGEHCNLWTEVGIAERWSHNFFGDKEAIDAILIPSSLHDGRGWEYVADSFRVYRPRYLFGRHGAIKRWVYRHGKHQGRGYSDHLPVLASFSTAGAQASASRSASSWWERTLEWTKGLLGSRPASQPMVVEPMQAVATPQTHPNAPRLPSLSIAQIKRQPTLTQPVRIDDAHVYFKRGESAVIGQRPSEEAILLYRAARQLEAGRCYDLIAYKKKRYKGLDELVDVEIDRDRGECETDAFIRPFAPSMLRDPHAIGQVVRDMDGDYNGHTIRIDGVEVPIHFRRKAGRPKTGTHLKILRAQIGYYKDHTQLVVWSKEDYRK